MNNRVRLEWTTETTEHHAITLDVTDVPRWVLDLLEQKESGIAEGEFIDPTTDDLQFLTEREDPGTTLQHTDNSEQSYISRIELLPPTPAEVGYHSHDGIRVAEYGPEVHLG